MNPFTIEGEVIPNLLVKKIIESGYINTYNTLLRLPQQGFWIKLIN